MKMRVTVELEMDVIDATDLNVQLATLLDSDTAAEVMAARETLTTYKITACDSDEDAVKRAEAELGLLADSTRRRWQPNIAIPYYGSDRTYTARPGLFVYGGMGSGDFYAPGGIVVYCSPSEARQLADLLGLDFERDDSFRYHR